jgi:hypothetical protein
VSSVAEKREERGRFVGGEIKGGREKKGQNVGEKSGRKDAPNHRHRVAQPQLTRRRCLRRRRRRLTGRRVGQDQLEQVGGTFDGMRAVSPRDPHFDLSVRMSERRRRGRNDDAYPRESIVL